MDTQNVTLSLPRDLLLKAKLIAVKQGTSMSGLMTTMLEDLVRQEHDFERARRRHQAWLREAEDLGTYGQAAATRDQLHERR